MILLLLPWCLSGCFLWTTRGEGDLLRQSTDTHAQRLEALDQRISKLEAGLVSEQERLATQITQLQQVLDEATAVLRRNNADVGAEVQQLKEQLAAVEGQLAETMHHIDNAAREAASMRGQLEQRLDKVARKAGLDMPIDEKEIPKDKVAHYTKAYRAFQNNEHSVARALFRAYMERYSDDDQVDDAQYWIGLSYLSAHRPATALGEFQKIIKNHSKSNVIDDALYGMAESFWQLHACTDAKNALAALLKRRPRKALLQQAKQLQRQVQRAKGGYCTS